MELPPLPADALALFVFGPGVGELVVVRAPPGEWLVVDSCRVAGVAYAERLLDHYCARPSMVVLSHPHCDHAGGLAQVVERWTPEGAEVTWPTLGMVEPPDTRGAGRTADPRAAFVGGTAEHAVATIRTRWEHAPSRAWAVEVGSRRMLGDARVTVLAPETTARTRASRRVAKRQPLRWNELSTALLVEWEAVRLVLGSDLVEKPGGGWTAIASRFAKRLDHEALKVPHHGSSPALHDPMLGRGRPTGACIRVVTPFASQNLPRFDAGPRGGIARLQQTSPEVHLTALPRAHAAQGGAPGERIARKVLASAPRDVRWDPPTPGFPDCFVACVFDSSGQPTLTHGPSSVVVV